MTHVDKSDLAPNSRAAESETINSRLSHAVTLEESLLFHLSRSAFARSHPSSHRSSSSLQIRQLGCRSSMLTPPAPSLPPWAACLSLGVFVKLLSYHRARASVLKSVFWQRKGLKRFKPVSCSQSVYVFLSLLLQEPLYSFPLSHRVYFKDCLRCR